MSLSQHLTSASAAHGRLAFHPDCPRCAHRLAGELGTDQLVGLRSQAAVAAAVLAFSAGAGPTAAVANQVAQPGEGTTDPGPEGPGMDPGFDPGGDDGYDGETDTSPGGEGGGESDDGDGPPVETEPFNDPTPDQIDPDAPPEVEQPPAPQPPAQPPAQAPPPVAQPPAPAPAPPPVAAPPAPAPVPAPAPAPAPPAAPAPPPAPEPEATPRTSRGDQPDQERERRKSKRGPAAGAPAPVAAPAPSAAPVVVEQTPAPTDTAAEVVPVSQRPAEPAAAPEPERLVAGASYRVRPGDSLWSIARRALAGGASNGQLAREVARLWRLNEDRIATGDPSMLHVGTVLRLR